MQASHPHSERRSAERFLVSLPVETDTGPGMTRDISASGLYLLSDRRLAAGERLRLVVTVPDHDPARPVRFILTGRVVRVENVDGAVGAGIAWDEESTHFAYAS